MPLQNATKKSHVQFESCFQNGPVWSLYFKNPLKVSFYNNYSNLNVQFCRENSKKLKMRHILTIFKHHVIKCMRMVEIFLKAFFKKVRHFFDKRNVSEKSLLPFLRLWGLLRKRNLEGWWSLLVQKKILFFQMDKKAIS